MGGGGTVIRLGGNALFPRGSDAPRFALLDALANYCVAAHDRTEQVVVIPGGVGGQLIIEWGRHIDAKEATLAAVGRGLIDLVAMMLADALSMRLAAHGPSVAPVPALDRASLHTLLGQHEVVVSGCAIEGAITSDSLAVLTAELLGFSVLSIKGTIPYPAERTVRAGGPDGVFDASAARLFEALAQDATPNRAGWHPSLDVWALRVLMRSDTRLVITTPDGLEHSSQPNEMLPRLHVGP